MHSPFSSRGNIGNQKRQCDGSRPVRDYQRVPCLIMFVRDFGVPRILCQVVSSSWVEGGSRRGGEQLKNSSMDGIILTTGGRSSADDQYC